MAKRVAIATIGTRGDVQPYVALELLFRIAGTRLCLAHRAIFAKWSRNMASNSIRSAEIFKTL